MHTSGVVGTQSESGTQTGGVQVVHMLMPSMYGPMWLLFFVLPASNSHASSTLLPDSAAGTLTEMVVHTPFVVPPMSYELHAHVMLAGVAASAKPKRRRSTANTVPLNCGIANVAGESHSVDRFRWNVTIVVPAAPTVTGSLVTMPYGTLAEPAS